MQTRTKNNNTLAFETEVKNDSLGHKQGLSFVYSIQSPKSPRSHQHPYVIKIFPARELMRPWASNRRRLPDEPAVLLFNFFKHTVHSRYKKKKRQSHLSATHKRFFHTHPSAERGQEKNAFAFTVITLAASCVGREETVQGI